MPSSDRAAKVIAALLLLLGIQFWLIAGDGVWGGRATLWTICTTLILALIPPLRKAIFDIMQRIDRIDSPRAVCGIALGIALGATAYFLINARQQHIGTYPRIHDEFSYLIQTRMILHGRLWMPQHPLADFFDTFHVIVRPVYASKYFPGAALMYAPLIAASAPYWLAPAAFAGTALGAGFVIVTRMTRLSGGLLAATMLLANPFIRRAATLYTSAAPILLLFTLTTLAWLNWRRSITLRRQLLWAGVLGLLISWSCITRPVDALCFSLPLAAGVGWQLVRARAPRRILLNLGIMVLAGAPLLGVQLLANVGITGHVLDTPWALYARQYDPYDGYAFASRGSNLRPDTQVAQKIDFIAKYSRPNAMERQAPNLFRRWVHRELPNDMSALLPHPLLILLIPIAILTLWRADRAALVVTAPLIFFAYSLYTVADMAYLLISALPGALLVICGIEAITQAWRSRREMLLAWLVPCVLALCMISLPQLNRFKIDELFRPVELAQIDQALASLPQTPAVVLFHYTSGQDNPEVEPVYNVGVPWPDDAEVIRAHDLGPRNTEIFHYYAQRQPSRTFYLYNRTDGAVTRLGTAKDLAGQP